MRKKTGIKEKSVFGVWSQALIIKSTSFKVHSKLSLYPGLHYSVIGSKLFINVLRNTVSCVI